MDTMKERKIKLPEPKSSGMTLEEAIRRRRSVREYSDDLMSMNELSSILFSAGGITGEEMGYKLRAYPSAGALYPIDIFLSAQRIEGLNKGLYLYSNEDHSLVLLKEGDFSDALYKASLEQDQVKHANLVIILVAFPGRMRWKYRDRTERYIFLEAGHISQNIYLQATSLGLGSVAIGAFHDELISRILELDPRRQFPAYVHAVGKT